MNNKSKFPKQNVYWGVTAFLVVAACMLFFFLLFRLHGILEYLAKFLGVLQPVIIGLVIAYLVNPMVDGIDNRLMQWIEKHGKHKKFAQKAANAVSVFGALLCFLLILFLLIYMVVPQFLESITSLVKTVPDQLDAFVATINNELKKNSDLQKIVMSIYESGKHWLQTDLTRYVTSMASYFASGVWSVVSFLKNFALGFIFALYILFNKKTLMRQFRKLMFAIMNKQLVARIVHTGRRANKIFSGFIYGKLLDSLIIGVLCFIGVTILNMPYTMLVAVIIGVTNVIPVFGPYIGAVPCTALILLYDPIKGLYFIIFIILLQALDGNLIGPKILGNSTGLSAFWVVFAILVGGGLFGVLGMLIGVPVFAVIYYLASTLVNHWIRKKKLPVQSDFYDEQSVDRICSPQPTAEKGEQV